MAIQELSRVNVFVGANNSGKTSILEAIKIMSEPMNIGLLVSVASRRASASTEQKKKNLTNYVLSIFQQGKEDERDKTYGIAMTLITNKHKYSYAADGTTGELINYTGETKQTVDIAVSLATDDKKAAYARDKIVNNEDYTFESTQRAIYPAIYISSSISIYRSCAFYLSDYIIREGKGSIIQVLQAFDSNIEDISVVGEDIYLFNSVSGSMPLFSYGLGLQKAVLLTSVILYCKNGTILIDEIDNAIHVSAFADVFAWFIDACLKYNVQAFVTTHSLEATDAIIAAAHDNHQAEDILRVITLRKDPTQNITRYKLRDGETAYSDREMFRTELRV